MSKTEEALFKDRASFSEVRLTSQEQYMLGTLVKMGHVPTPLHARLKEAMNKLQVSPVAREVAEIFMDLKSPEAVSSEAHDLYTYLRLWAGKEDRIPAA